MSEQQASCPFTGKLCGEGCRSVCIKALHAAVRDDDTHALSREHHGPKAARSSDTEPAEAAETAREQP